MEGHQQAAVQEELQLGRSATLATFKQLHVKLPTETFREPAPENWGGEETSSDLWLDAHPLGFLLIHNLHTVCPPGKCILIKSEDTGELLVNKRLKRYAPQWVEEGGQPPDWREKVGKSLQKRTERRRKRKRDEEEDNQGPEPLGHQIAFHTPAPPELRFARLTDPRVEVRLPDEPYFATLYAYGLPGSGNDFDSHGPGQPDIFSLYFERCNGGTLANLLEMYSDTHLGAPVPEPFVWHVIEQLCLAVIFLHTGLTHEELEAGENRPKQGWTPVVHRNITEKNILLHFAAADPDDLGPLDRCFPRIVLEGFNQANLVTDPPGWWSMKGAVNAYRTQRGLEQVPPSTWEDIHMVGQVLRRLVTAYETVRYHPDQGLEFDVDADAPLRHYLPRNLYLRAGQKPAYSDRLIYLLQLWEIQLLQHDPRRHFSDEEVRPTTEINRIDLLIETALPLARAAIAGYRDMDPAALVSTDANDDGLMGDVSWVMPDPTFETTPYSSERGHEYYMLQDFQKELRWLFGPYIPVRYRYGNVNVSDIPTDAMKAYMLPAAWDAARRSPDYDYESSLGSFSNDDDESDDDGDDGDGVEAVDWGEPREGSGDWDDDGGGDEEADGERDWEGAGFGLRYHDGMAPEPEEGERVHDEVEGDHEEEGLSENDEYLDQDAEGEPEDEDQSEGQPPKTTGSKSSKGSKGSRDSKGSSKKRSARGSSPESDAEPDEGHEAEAPPRKAARTSRAAASPRAGRKQEAAAVQPPPEANQQPRRSTRIAAAQARQAVSAVAPAAAPAPARGPAGKKRKVKAPARAAPEQAQAEASAAPAKRGRGRAPKQAAAKPPPAKARAKAKAKPKAKPKGKQAAKPKGTAKARGKQAAASLSRPSPRPPSPPPPQGRYNLHRRPPPP